MNDEVYDDMAIEQNAKLQFGQSIEIEHVIVRLAPVGRMAKATVFLTTKKMLLVYIDGPTKLLLDDVVKIIARMGLVAELYLPPKGRPHYFDEIATERFKTVFPGLNSPTDADLRYYRRLAPYKPALVQILEVKNGQIYQYDTDAPNDWRPAVKFAYRRIRTS
jgi:hypothetical protein